MRQNKLADYTAIKHCHILNIKGRRSSFDSRISQLPTVKKKDHKKDDNGITIRRSFSFNPIPVTESPLYYGVITLFPRDEAEISLYPAFGFMRTLGESRDQFFTFHNSPFAFAEENQSDRSDIKHASARRKVWGATKKFASHGDAYSCLRSYYAWFVHEVVPFLSLKELGRITRDHNGLKEEFISFCRGQPLY